MPMCNLNAVAAPFVLPACITQQRYARTCGRLYGRHKAVRRGCSCAQLCAALN